MAEAPLAARLAETIEPLATSHGLELVAVEVAGGKDAPIVRVFLDREGGLDLDAVAEAGRWVSELFDEHDWIPGAYTLEVSSPGIERPLTKLEHFERFAGSDAVVQTTDAIGGRRKFTGRILRVEGDDVVLDIDGTEHHIPHRLIGKARLRVEIDFGQEGTGGAR